MRTIWLLATTPLMFCAAGCSDSRAPAMTQPARSQAAPTEDSVPAAEPPPADSAKTAESERSSTAAATVDSPEPERSEDPAAGSDRIRDISFDDLKFDINKGDSFQRSLLTGKIEALDGKQVRIRGYILPSFQQTGLTQFVLVRDNLSCCFGPGAAIYDCVIVEMKPGRATDYSLYPVAVDGAFTIREMLDPDGKAVAIYHLDGEQVR